MVLPMFQAPPAPVPNLGSAAARRFFCGSGCAEAGGPLFGALSCASASASALCECSAASRPAEEASNL